MYDLMRKDGRKKKGICIKTLGKGIRKPNH